jgi:hypothetical protein
MSKHQTGYCRICGKECKLTYEHIPPKGAFNNNKHFYTSTVNPLHNSKSTDFRELTEIDLKTAKKQQGGIGFYTLCSSCNNSTGSWYAEEYIRWVYFCRLHLHNQNYAPSTPLKFPIYPLKIIKQIIAMFLSLNYREASITYPSLKNYILHKESNKLDPAIRIFVYYNTEGKVRYIANNVIGHFNDSSTYHVSEITFPPIGLVMSIGTGKPEKELTEITWFNSYKYDELINYSQLFNLLPTHLNVPCDYRTEEEIRKALKDAEKYM